MSNDLRTFLQGALLGTVWAVCIFIAFVGWQVWR